MKSILLVLICLSLLGCCATSKNKKLEEQITGLQESLAKKDEEIKVLQDALREKESLLNEKDSSNKQLRKELEALGVFK